jgi:succinate dehydrogenase / fumarate reductase cytochrome b subunit
MGAVGVFTGVQESMDQADRPLSPHVFHYRWGVTMTLSILHRMTGVVLSVGLLVLVCWLVSLAAGEAVYDRVMPFYSMVWFAPLYLAWVFCFFYHLANGIRHMCWDVGYGFEPGQIRTGAVIVVLFALAATAVFAAIVVF